MYSGRKLPVLILVLVIVLWQAMSAGAQQIRFPDFSTVANLQLNGSSQPATWNSNAVLRLTKGTFASIGSEAGSTFFNVKQPVAPGFTTYFAFQFHNPTSLNGPGDGLAFVLQNSTSTDSSMGASGQGLTALGAGNDPLGAGGLGYAGIPNSLVVEFDISQNAWDPNANHVAVQSCGINTNTPVHVPGRFTIGHNTDVQSCLLNSAAITSHIPMLAGTCAHSVCSDGAVHYAVIEYAAPQGSNPNGTLMVWVDPQFIPGTHTPERTSLPVINIPYTINGVNGLSLDPLNGGSAWVGFSASQSTQETAQDILQWEFTPHTNVSVQQLIPDGGIPNPFVFGGHDMVVTYPVGTNGNGLYMTVEATPISRALFYQTRLANTQFSNELCVEYLETGGNCIVYSITCQLSDRMTPTTCPSEQEDTILLNTSYYTADPITNDNADFLKTDPIGSNNWMSICNPPGSNPPCYDPNTFDGTTSGKGKNLSDLVATFSPLQRGPHVPNKQEVALPAKPAVIKPKP